MAKPGNPGTGKHWTKSDFKSVILTDDKYTATMGQKMDSTGRSKASGSTDYSKDK